MSRIIYKGESFVIGGGIFFPAGSDDTLENYDIVVMITTAETGKSVKAYTEDDRGSIRIERRSWNRYAIQFTGEHTLRLSEGTLTISMALIHKVTGVKQLAEEGLDVIVKATRFATTDL